MSLVPQQGLKRFIVGLLVWTVVVMAGIPALYSAGPEIESRLFPVADHFIITDVVMDGSAQVYGSFHKERSCPVVRWQWYAGTPDTSLILLKDSGSSLGNDIGYHKFGPLFFDKEKVINGDSKIYGVGIYRCHPLWNVIVNVGPFDLRQYFRHQFIIPPEALIPEK